MNKRVNVELEFIFRCSKAMLFKFLTTQEGLQSWFCNEVDIEDGIYTFYWAGESESAAFATNSHHDFVEFNWLDRDKESTVFKISKSPVTNDTVLTISTFCAEDEVEEEDIYWNNIIEELKSATGG